MAGSIETTLLFFTVLNEFFVAKHTVELSDFDKVEVLLGLLIAFSLGSRRVRVLASEDIAILFKDEVNESSLTNTGWSNKNQRLVLQWSRIERVEVLFTIDKNVVLKQ